MDKKRMNYETELPEGYEEIYHVDATTRRFTIVMNLVALAMMLAIIIPAAIIIRPISSSDFSENILVKEIFFILATVVYIVLHELVHGAAYWYYTGHKLKFGITASVAFCGVPDIYVYRKASMIALLAPFTLFSILFIMAAIVCSSPMDRFLCWVLFAVHFGGCVGDLHNTFLYLTRFRHPKILMCDTGPRQTFYHNERKV